MQYKLMTWNPNGKNNHLLYVLSDTKTWEPYTKIVPAHLQKPDVTMKSSYAPMSKGYATMQNLLKLGWKVVDGSMEV